MYLSKTCCIREKEVLFEQKWIYSGKLVVFNKEGSIRENWLFSGKVVVLG